MIANEEPTGTAAGNCRRCGTWSAMGRIVAEIHSDSGAGATIVECPIPCQPERSQPSLRRHPAQPRTWSG